MAMTRTFVLPALLLLLALPLSAQARSLDAPKAPPSEPVYEVDPGDRPGYTRVMGHWEWTGENFMWSPGHWVADKEGHVWVADSWAQRGKKWHLTPGHYEPDSSATIAAEATETLHTDRPDTAAEDMKDRAEPTVTRIEEMDDVEQQVLNPSKKSAKQAATATAKPRKAKRAVKKVNYQDPKQFPFHRRTSR